MTNSNSLQSVFEKAKLLQQNLFHNLRKQSFEDIFVTGFIVSLDIALSISFTQVAELPLIPATTFAFLVTIATHQLVLKFTRKPEQAAPSSSYPSLIPRTLIILSVRWPIVALFAGTSLPDSFTVILLISASLVSYAIYAFVAARHPHLTSIDHAHLQQSRWPRLYFFVACAFLITSAYQTDILRGTDKHVAKEDRFSNGFIYGRLITTKQHGPFFNSGLMNWAYDPVLDEKGLSGGWKATSTLEIYNQIAADGNNSSLQYKVRVYRGNIGLQGWFYSAIEPALDLLEFSGPNKRTVHTNLTRLLTGIALSALLTLLVREFGFLAGSIGLISLIGASWINTASESVYWVPFLWFLPVLISWHGFVTRYQPETTTPPARYFVLLYLTLLIKFGAGFEYVTAILVACGTIAIYKPLCEFDILKVIRTGALTTITCLAAVATGILIQTVIIGTYLGGFGSSLNNFLSRVRYRTSFSGKENQETLSLTDTVSIYLSNKPVVEFGKFSLTANELLLSTSALGIISLSFLLLKKRDIKKNLGIASLFSLSLLGSISWHIIANNHSQIHQHLNFSLWHLSWGIIGPVTIAGLIGSALQNARSNERFILPLMMLGVVSFTTIFTSSSVTSSKLPKQAYLYSHSVDEHIVSVNHKSILVTMPCNQIKKAESFFFHIYTNKMNGAVLNKPRPIINRDFSADTVTRRHTFSSKCFFEIKNNGIPITDIHYGQYNLQKFKRGEPDHRYWTKRLKIAPDSKTYTLSRETLSDANWSNGIHRSENAIFLKNTMKNNQAAAYIDALVLSNGTVVKIQRIQHSPRYLNIYFEDGPLDDLPKELNFSSNLNTPD